jgi:gliding motility-associated-like protein
MKRLVVLILMFVGVTVNAQLTVTTGALTPTQYVQNVLIGGGVTVSNVTFSGQANQIGEFNATNTNPLLGINNGIILATGDVANALGPNNSGSASIGGGNFGVGDPDLDILEGTGAGTNDAAILEFDFIPTGDTVKFNFVFGSEEYPEFVNSINDVFGFFLSGPGISGPFSNNAMNIALVPGTATPVTINTVNPGANAAYYYDNTPNTGAQTVQYDGYTVVMTAIGVVQCGVQYHIKIAIADASDTSWDSGVFLEGGSFSSNTVTLSSNIDINGNDSILYEGCGTAFLDFVRDNITDTSTYNFTITGTAGTTDYTISSSSIVFLPGQDTVTLSFTALQDGLVEPLETVNIQLIQIICGIPDTQTVTFYISDYPQPQLITNDTIKPCGTNDSIPIWVNVVGPPYTTLWNNGATTDTIWVNPIITTTYYVTVSDTCGVYSVTDSATVSVINLQVTVPDYTMTCLNELVTLTTTIVGGAGNETILWSNGATTPSIQVSPSVTTAYIVDVNGACSASDTVTVTVSVFLPVVLTANSDDTLTCPGDLVVLTANMAGGFQQQVYNWTDGISTFTGNNISVNPIVTSTYTVWVNDSCAADGDTISFTVTVPNYAPLQLVVSNDTLICVGEQAFLEALVIGGEGTYSYSWTGGFTSNFIQVNPTSDINYNITVTDGCGAQVSSSVFVTVISPTADFSYEYLSEFGVQFTDSSYYSIVSTWWTFDQDGAYTDQNPLYNFTTDGEHEVWLAVEDSYGCFDTIMKTIIPPIFIYGPNAFTPDGDGNNDVFKFKGMGIEHFELMIFDRWGELLFKADDINRGWDGTYKGKEVPVGVYVYKVRAESYENRVVETAGSVNLIK